MEVTLVGILRLNTTQQFKRDDATTWTEKNPVLLEGEPGLELDTGKIKIGDGVSNWNAIPYFMGDKLDNKANVELTNVTNQAFKSKAYSAGVGKEKVISATYGELQKLVNDQSLIPGQKYLLSDYRTVYQQPITDIIKTSAPEQLLLTALDTAHFSPECNSLNYPQDIVTYDFNMNICEDNTTPRNGFITWRKSTNINGNYAEISMPQDWRTMLWARYKIDPDYYLIDSTKTLFKVWTSGARVSENELYKSGNRIYISIKNGMPDNSTDAGYFSIVIIDINIGICCQNINIAQVDSKKLYLIKSNNYLEYKSVEPNSYRISFSSSPESLQLHNNVISGVCSNSTFGCNCYNNTLLAGASYNVFGSYCRDNILMQNCTLNRFEAYDSNNVLMMDSRYNSFGTQSSYNMIHYNASFNSFGNGCSWNTLLFACADNTFGIDCSYNSLGAISTINRFGNYIKDNSIKRSFYCNFALNNFQKNNIGENASYNIFGTAFAGNTIGNNCCDNTFGSEFVSNAIDVNFMTNTIGNLCRSNTFGSNFRNTDVKKLMSKNISNINFNKDYVSTIELDSSLRYVNWYINSSGQVVRTLIP